MHHVLREALQQAVRWQVLARNPADAVKPPKVERGQMSTYDVGQRAVGKVAWQPHVHSDRLGRAVRPAAG
jgi:hypothetical protein